MLRVLLDGLDITHGCDFSGQLCKSWLGLLGLGTRKKQMAVIAAQTFNRSTQPILS